MIAFIRRLFHFRVIDDLSGRGSLDSDVLVFIFRGPVAWRAGTKRGIQTGVEF